MDSKDKDIKDNTNNVKFLFNEDVKEVRGDDNLKRNKIMNDVLEKHGNAMSEHSARYTKLLEEYIENSKRTAEQKKRFKDIFFKVAIWTLCLSFLLFAVICLYFSTQDCSEIDIEDLSGLISSLIGLLSLYIIIPRIIAEYLFNVKEDEHMAKIVKSVQKYDAKVFANINSDKQFLPNENEKEEEKAVMSDLKKNAEEKIKKEEEMKNQNNVLPDTPKDNEIPK